MQLASQRCIQTFCIPLFIGQARQLAQRIGSTAPKRLEDDEHSKPLAGSSSPIETAKDLSELWGTWGLQIGIHQDVPFLSISDKWWVSCPCLKVSVNYRKSSQLEFNKFKGTNVIYNEMIKILMFRAFPTHQLHSTAKELFLQSRASVPSVCPLRQHVHTGDICNSCSDDLSSGFVLIHTSFSRCPNVSDVEKTTKTSNQCFGFRHKSRFFKANLPVLLPHDCPPVCWHIARPKAWHQLVRKYAPCCRASTTGRSSPYCPRLPTSPPPGHGTPWAPAICLLKSPKSWRLILTSSRPPNSSACFKVNHG